MAVTKQLLATSLVLDVESGVDNSGKPVYRKKSFAGINADATPENVLAVALAIKSVFAGETRSIALAETHKLISE